MTHEISELDLLAMVEGTADAAVSGRIQAHLNVCAECARRHDEFRTWHGRLVSEGERMRDAMRFGSDTMERLLADSMQRIAAAQPSGNQCGAAEGLVMLRSLLSPVFGRGTVEATTEMALQRTAPGGITGSTWRNFSAVLSEMVEAVCGIAAGKLVIRAAAALPVAVN